VEEAVKLPEAILTETVLVEVIVWSRREALDQFGPLATPSSVAV
jgi:hypothetical protein